MFGPGDVAYPCSLPASHDRSLSAAALYAADRREIISILGPSVHVLITLRGSTGHPKSRSSPGEAGTEGRSPMPPARRGGVRATQARRWANLDPQANRAGLEHRPQPNTCLGWEDVCDATRNRRWKERRREGLAVDGPVLRTDDRDHCPDCVRLLEFALRRHAPRGCGGAGMSSRPASGYGGQGALLAEALIPRSRGTSK